MDKIVAKKWFKTLKTFSFTKKLNSQQIWLDYTEREQTYCKTLTPIFENEQKLALSAQIRI